MVKQNNMNNEINFYRLTIYSLIFISIGFIAFGILTILDYLVTMQYTVNSHLSSNIKYSIEERKDEINFIIKCFVGLICYSILIILFLVRTLKIYKNR
jgi:hypothetical protein